MFVYMLLGLGLLTLCWRLVRKKVPATDFEVQEVHAMLRVRCPCGRVGPVGEDSTLVQCECGQVLHVQDSESEARPGTLSVQAILRVRCPCGSVGPVGEDTTLSQCLTCTQVLHVLQPRVA